jgi:hypothetical protein
MIQKNELSKPSALMHLFEKTALDIRGDEKSKELMSMDELHEIFEDPISTIVSTFEISKEEALVFIGLVYYSIAEDDTYAREMCGFLHVSPFEKINIESLMESLVSKRLAIRHVSGSRRKFEKRYFVQKFVLQELNRGHKPEFKKLQYDCFELADEIAKLYEEVDDGHSEPNDFIQDILSLKSANSDLEVFKIAEECKMNDEELAVFMIIYCNSVTDNNSTDIISIAKKLFTTTRVRQDIKLKFCKVGSELFLNKILDFEENNFFNERYVVMTEECMGRVLDGKSFGEKNQKKQGICKTIEASSIRPKEMFYNPDENEPVMMLRNAIGQEKYSEIISRMDEEGMPKGLTILLHGYPGTGKTETVLQLARQSGRSLYQVDVSQVRDKYVGESEKRLKEIFNTYRKLCKSEELKPILFFNEADALIGKRINVTTSVDSMHNIMQNILLEELEKFEGIFMATTNLLHNMDDAFDRRFLFKIKFMKPNSEMRLKIWKSKLSGVEEEVLEELSSRYELSGGQVDNIVRKTSLKKVLEGISPTREQLIDWCEGEFMQRNGRDEKRIGY